MPDKRLVLLDGYSLLFRAFYGTRFLSTSDGRPTNALFGFTNTLLALLSQIKPDAMAVALDAPGKTFRHVDFAEYKGTRRETPAELESQLDISRDLISALNIPVLELVGYEADDVIGTVSRLAEEQGYKTTIVSGDKDSLQLVDEHVSVMMPGIRGADAKVYDPEAVRERFGFEPIQMVDYKALAGDPSDNIPGVPGVGEKTATLLVQRYGDVETLIERLSEVEEKYRKKIEPALDKLELSKRLATIDRHCPLEYDFRPYRIDTEHLHRAVEMLLSLEFKSQAKRLERELAPYMTEGAAAAVVTVGSESLVFEELAPLGSPPALREWIGRRPWSIVPVAQGTQPSMFEPNQASEAYLAVGREVRRVPMPSALTLFSAFAENAVGHDTKPLYHQVERLLTPPRFDSMVAGYVLQSSRSTYDLDDLAQGYLESTARTPQLQAVALLELEGVMRGRLEAEGQTDVYESIEGPLIPILAEMERTGIRVDPQILIDLSKSLEVSIEQARVEVWSAAGTEFNIGSPKQIGEVLFEKLGLPGGKKTKTGWATGVEILSEMEHPVAHGILNYRELTKLKSTYADALPKLIAKDGRVHTTFNQTVAATGRLSSNDPNLQNIPVRTELGRQIRRAFVADPGFQLDSFDYSQIELRVLAHVSQDPNLVRAFQEKVDVHTVTAALMFKVAEGQVTKEQRRLAKLLNYAVLYGVTDFGLANQLGPGFGRKEAAELISQYNERFPSVKSFTNGMVEEARAKGFTTTMCGRRRHFPDIHAANRGVRQYAERQAMNAPIQGTAADMIKLAMIQVRGLIDGRSQRLLLQVHDELVFESTVNEEDLLPVRRAMENALPLSVPVEVDFKRGSNWLDMSPVGRPDNG
ncbi:MAG: DNA polymerase I [Fimbriimonadaceae bacterium]|nr:DNA polymerase I [Fimbriimonadaceae bacterium]QYK57367.1 MAG: DNA polymerase I [Fimbriimonadaceae bacterium]